MTLTMLRQFGQKLANNHAQPDVAKVQDEEPETSTWAAARMFR